MPKTTTTPPARSPLGAAAPLAARAAAMLACAAPAVTHAQTDYYNTDRGRPVQVEDAYATERYAFELKLAPVRVERAARGAYAWGVEPELAYGILPRTQLEIGAPIVAVDAGATHRVGLGGVDVSVLHNFNVETSGVPALAVRADVLAPVGALAAERAYPSLTAIATRTYRFARFHVNGQYTFGRVPDATPSASGSAAAVDLSRWLAGVAADRALPLQSVLLTAELYGRKPLAVADGRDVEYTVGGGVRWQLGPSLALDAGAGRRLTGDAQATYVTFGSALAFGVGSLFPRAR